MEHVRIDDLDTRIQPAAVRKRLTEPLGATDVSINYYELEPGDSFGFAYHAHEIQEEVFYVQEGTATFETEAGEVTVSAGEAIRFEPGEFQRGWNRDKTPVIALGIGAPLEDEDVEKLRDCDTCGSRTRNRLEGLESDDVPGGFAVVAICEECGGETGRWAR